jgi:hypothetical protein
MAVPNGNQPDGRGNPQGTRVREKCFLAKSGFPPGALNDCKGVGRQKCWLKVQSIPPERVPPLKQGRGR